MHDARKKIHALARALGYDDISAVRLAIATSQVSRALAAGDGSARIEASLRVANDRTALVLRFIGPSRREGPWLAGDLLQLDRAGAAR